MAKYANLRDKVSFPGVLDLPDYQIYDPEHYKHVSDQVIEPRRHWCLLAEIIKINKGFPFKLTARSLYNEEPFHIVFHTPDLGDSFVTPDLKLERTVCHHVCSKEYLTLEVNRCYCDGPLLDQGPNMAKELRKTQELSQFWRKGITGVSTARHYIVLQ
ncbi:uncharacterized protein P174DRAFT_430344 [Aspergillus novofumigatus IBT 16806]|uniref:Uncharacterized protein n=1 Tax=Aspergillus novofumigatus (strain IBT 16806) TaxID=1392255 RepID=A0A2I1CEJ8_ASPN1|nr:uncharacterized protein P174DRAFT_430344 [Aspergillus novofumigatus IBT 16806]PKX96049.1 hypothetical protein P174DRAFT_430344 [Aspergillus novofumigatus IBT 16806]